MKRVRYKIYLTTGAILAVDLFGFETTMGLSDVCKQMKDGDWPIWMACKVKVCINPAHVVYVTAEEIEE